jgi:broad specificity phosphatase PhoE
MTTTFILIRHGAHDLLGRKIAGRMPGVGLNAAGQTQAQGLSERVAEWRIAAIYAGPLQRVQETAVPLGRRLGKAVETDPAFDEIDFGHWTGLAFDELREDRMWDRWNGQRGLAGCPGGESFTEVHARVARGLDRLAHRHPEQAVALITHGDVIKAAVSLALGLPLDCHARFEIGPASLTVLLYGDWGTKLLKLNEEPRHDGT